MSEDKSGRAQSWFPVARSEEIVKRHIFQSELFGQEVAIWRDDAGLINAWENRCPHRGVRLSIGINGGTTLRCQYHGFQYATGTGQCTFVPAHPNQKAPSVIRATAYGCAQQYGFVWVNLAQVTGVPAVPAIGVDQWTTLRSIFVQAPASLVRDALAVTHQNYSAASGFILEATSGTEKTVLLLQPVNDSQTVIHGLLTREARGTDRLALLRLHNDALRESRDAIEREAARLNSARDGH